MSKTHTAHSALFTKKAKGFDALQNLIDRTLLPTAPVANRNWEKGDEHQTLVFLTNGSFADRGRINASASPIGRIFDAVDNNVIAVNGIKFSSMMSLWAYASHTTKNGEVDDNLRTKWGSRLVTYINDNRNETITETADLMHQWSIIVAGIATYITERSDDIKTAIEQHMKNYDIGMDTVKQIEFVVPVSKSRFSRMYQEAMSYCWADIVDYVFAITQNEEKRGADFSTRVSKAMGKFYQDEVLEKARIQNANAGVDESWFTIEAFLRSIREEKIVFHNENSLLSKLWIDGGQTGLSGYYNDFLVAVGMFKKHHAWQMFDFSEIQALDNKYQLERVAAAQDVSVEKNERLWPAKFSMQDIADLIALPEYKDFVFGVHSQTSEPETLEPPVFKIPEITESFTERNARTLRALCLFRKGSFKTRVFFDEEANGLLDNLWHSDIMLFAAGPTGYIQTTIYGGRIASSGNEILTAIDIAKKAAAAAMQVPGSEDVLKSEIDYLSNGRDQANDLEWEQKMQENPSVDPVKVLDNIVNSMIPQDLEDALTYKPKTFQKKEYSGKSKNGNNRFDTRR